ncbi:uncharacterized protein HaLaN_24292 [Haematococcus lacustris]|uniref:Uncharacterized protein n=1 Tax=Haematococcus lacustris TaxID=44745 RepID=A0A6A0A2A5_HAELA|nr:uncharacterized protein HaLaN_24292 [Haematococcus lacustris]
MLDQQSTSSLRSWIRLQPHTLLAAGAVVYGRCPELIHARRSRMAYGALVCCSVCLPDGALPHCVRACAPYPDGAPGKFWHNEESAFYSDSVFQVFVLKNQKVGTPYAAFPGHAAEGMHAALLGEWLVSMKARGEGELVGCFAWHCTFGD